MKSFVYFSLILVVAKLAPAAAASQDDYPYEMTNFDFGHRENGDMLLAEVVSTKPPAPNAFIFFARATDDYVWIGSKQLKNKVITAIKLYQQKELKFKTNRVRVQITEGGPGKRFVGFKLTSEKASGFRYKIYVFGK